MPVKLAEIKAETESANACADLLRNILERAEKGEINGLAVVFSEPGPHTGQGIAGEVGTAILGQLEMAKFDIAACLAEEGVDTPD